VGEGFAQASRSPLACPSHVGGFRARHRPQKPLHKGQRASPLPPSPTVCLQAGAHAPLAHYAAHATTLRAKPGQGPKLPRPVRLRDCRAGSEPAPGQKSLVATAHSPLGSGMPLHFRAGGVRPPPYPTATQDNEPSDHCGTSRAASGDTVVVGARDPLTPELHVARGYQSVIQARVGVRTLWSGGEGLPPTGPQSPPSHGGETRGPQCTRTEHRSYQGMCTLHQHIGLTSKAYNL
jgi:hypothetical protein